MAENNKIMNDEVVRMWKETRMTLLQVQNPAKSRKIPVRTSGLYANAVN
jgi:hypothetical protein